MSYNPHKSLAFRYLAEDYHAMEKEKWAVAQANRFVIDALDVMEGEMALNDLRDKVAQLSVEISFALGEREKKVKVMKERLDEICRVQDDATVVPPLPTKKG